jgi:hypothetical protein
MNAGRLGTKRAAVLLASLFTATISAQPARRTSQQFEIAVVRIDGALIPLASYDREQWSQAWPDAWNYPGLRSIWTRRGEAVPDRWHVLPLSGTNPIDGRVTGRGRVHAHCLDVPALLTDLPKAPWPSNSSPVPTFGIATHGEVHVTTVDRLKDSSEAWRRAERIVLADFDRREAAQREKQEAPLVETPAPQARLKAVYQEKDSASSPLYFVAQKVYGRGPIGDPGCGPQTVITGWLLPMPDGSHRLFAVKVFLTDCDQKELSTLVPTAKITTASSRSFWIAGEFGYEDESNVIFEIEPLVIRRVLQTSAGGC